VAGLELVTVLFNSTVLAIFFIGKKERKFLESTDLKLVNKINIVIEAPNRMTTWDEKNFFHKDDLFFLFKIN